MAETLGFGFVHSISVRQKNRIMGVFAQKVKARLSGLFAASG